ncbi:unnamed protein product [Soboliphyme baturini]|uniref:Glycerophosphocholine phosphodiesterase n=1 Tax=Soboliphyme baturini TaxID=241478 RepID=A0A183IKU8_9BILA|nr:unnamed protein product [Soboliphyme baturini]
MYRYGIIVFLLQISFFYLNAEEECEFPLERNDYIDNILKVLLNNVGRRQIMFSSFDPDTCLMLKMKQNRFHVLFLTQGKSQRYIAYMDRRTQSSEAAILFAFSNKLSGIVFHSEDMLSNIQPFHYAKAKKLVCFVWGNDLDSAKNIDHFTRLGFDGVIYDRYRRAT